MSWIFKYELGRLETLFHCEICSIMNMDSIMDWISSWTGLHYGLYSILYWIPLWTGFHHGLITLWTGFHFVLNSIMDWIPLWTGLHYGLDSILYWILLWTGWTPLWYSKLWFWFSTLYSQYRSCPTHKNALYTYAIIRCLLTPMAAVQPLVAFLFVRYLHEWPSSGMAGIHIYDHESSWFFFLIKWIYLFIYLFIFDFATVSVYDQLVVGPTHANGGTLDRLMTDVSDLLRVAVVSPLGN